MILDSQQPAVVQLRATVSSCQNELTYMFIPVSKGDDEVHSEQEALHRIDMCLSYSMGKTDVDDKVVTRFIPILYVFGH